MYDQAINQNAKTEIPIFQELLEIFEKQNAWQTEGLRSLDDRLHQLLNRRTPDKTATDVAKHEIGDFSQALKKNLSIMEENCKRIESLNAHLRMIC